MATSLGDALSGLGPHVRSHAGTVLTTAEGVAVGAALGVTLGSILTYVLQRELRIQTAHVTGRVVCSGQPVAGADIVLVGEYGPGANAVFDARTDADGRWAADVRPGLYSGTVQPRDGGQLAPGIVQADNGQTVYVVWPGC